jgi:hypothetical protein
MTSAEKRWSFISVVAWNSVAPHFLVGFEDVANPSDVDQR